MAEKMPYSTALVAKTIDAELIGSGDRFIEHLLTDSRRLIYPSKCLFFAIKTKSNDGHRYIKELYDNGVRSFVVQKSFKYAAFPSADFILVEDVLFALQNLTAHHRLLFHYPVVGITGSNGKTVVKEWLFQFLNHRKHVVRSPRSYNSQLGVPLSLWQMADHHNVALIEAGISEPNEMAKLEKMIQPTVGIFTNIGTAHAANFKNIEEKAREKAKLFEKCDRIIFCRDSQLIEQVLLDVVDGDENRLIGWSVRGTKKAISVTVEGSIAWMNLYGQTIEVPLPFKDKGSVENLLNAFVAAWYLGIPVIELATIAKSLEHVSMRLQERNGINGNLLINDFYNSDPESVRIALELLSQKPVSKKKIVVLSDFEGIGKTEKLRAYKDLANIIGENKIDEVIAIGDDIQQGIGSLNKAKKFYRNTEDFLRESDYRKWHDTAILLKGARSFGFERIAENLQEKIHQTWLEINMSAMAHNLRFYKNKLKPETQLMVMVKAFGYGAGIVEIARLLQFNKVDYLAVAYLDEGIELRKNGIDLPIMVMNPDPSAFQRLIEFNLEPEIFSLDMLNNFAASLAKHYGGTRFKIHLKLETGMNRLGLSQEELAAALTVIRNNRKIHLASAFSHLAASDMPTHDKFTKNQISRFSTLAEEVETTLDYKTIKHISNTAGISRFPEAQFDMVRLGIGLYGVANSDFERENLQLVTKWLTRISQIKKVSAGQSIGYGRSFIAREDAVAATLPVGYADGFFRALSNGVGQVYISGRKVPVLGKVCMDMIMVDVTGLNVKVGDQVEIMGEHITTQDLAQSLKTIPYEILTHISPRVPRIYLTE